MEDCQTRSSGKVNLKNSLKYSKSTFKTSLDNLRRIASPRRAQLDAWNKMFSSVNEVTSNNISRASCRPFTDKVAMIYYFETLSYVASEYFARSGTQDANRFFVKSAHPYTLLSRLE